MRQRRSKKKHAPHEHDNPPKEHNGSTKPVTHIHQQNTSDEQKNAPNNSATDNQKPANRPRWITNHWPRAEAWWAFFVAVFTGLLVLVAYKQWKSGDDQFRTAHRAHMALGKEDGTFMAFSPQGATVRIVAYFRNVGASLANDVIPDFYIFTAPPEMTINIGVPVAVPHTVTVGPSVAPGVPFVTYSTAEIKTADEQAVISGSKVLMVVGRIHYYDEFTSYCEAFSTHYDITVNTFLLLRNRIRIEQDLPGG